VDLTGLEPGIYDLPPTIFINQDETQEELTVDDVSLSPAVLTVEISSPEMLATQEGETEAGG